MSSVLDTCLHGTRNDELCIEKNRFISFDNADD
jgi:hypothetical protein